MIATIDAALLDAMAGLRGPVLDVFFSLVTWAGSLWLLAPAALLFVAAAGVNWRARILPVLALAGASLTCHALKIATDRPRPDAHPLVQALPADASFPSAHSAQAAAFFTALWLLLPPEARRRWAMPLVALVAIVGVSRLYLQVHWPSDVIVGAVLGVAVAFAANYLGRLRETA